MKQIADVIYSVADRSGVQLPPRHAPSKPPASSDDLAASVSSMATRLTALEELVAGSKMAAAPGRALSEVQASVDRAMMIVEAPYGVADVVLGADGASDSVVLRKGLQSEGSVFTIGRGNNASSPVLSMDVDGKVGIGTSSPATDLHVHSAGDAIVRVEGTGTGDYQGAALHLKAAGVTAGSQFALVDISMRRSPGGSCSAVYMRLER